MTYTGSQQYAIGGKTMRQQADSIIGAVDRHMQKNPKAKHFIVWLNPAMQPAGELAKRSIREGSVDVCYDDGIKPAAGTCGIEVTP